MIFNVAHRGQKKKEPEVVPHLQARLSRMALHRDLAGEYDWVVVDCDRKGAPMPVFVKPKWPATHELGAVMAEGAKWMLDARLPHIAAASGLGPGDTIANVLRSLPTSKLVTEDLATANRRTRQLRGAPHLWPHSANVLGRQHRASR